MLPLPLTYSSLAPATAVTTNGISATNIKCTAFSEFTTSSMWVTASKTLTCRPRALATQCDVNHFGHMDGKQGKRGDRIATTTKDTTDNKDTHEKHPSQPTWIGTSRRLQVTRKATKHVCPHSQTNWKPRNVATNARTSFLRNLNMSTSCRPIV